MDNWEWCDYLEANGTNPIAEWVAQLSRKARAKFDRRLESMASLKKEEWAPSWIRSYSTADGVLEIRFEVLKQQYRPLFCFGPNRRLILLAGATEHDGKLVPRKVEFVAERRRKEALENSIQVVRHGDLEHELDEETSQ